tara:strand:- start:2743 stop:3549 length:807 start_codon:yes stop_codon:yes gene_type:complete
MLMTEETKLKLKENIETRIEELTKELDLLGQNHKNLQISEKFSKENMLNVDFTGVRNLMNYRIFTGILTLDLSCSILSYLNAKFQYEGLFSARQIIVIISEGYKKIYNFTYLNEKGDLVKKNRNSSFWIKEVGFLINLLPEFKSKYDSITKNLDGYLLVNFELLKKQRDLFIHYDKEPMKVIDTLSALDIEETFKKMVPFLQILNEMSSFTSNLSQAYLEKITKNRLDFNTKLNQLEAILLHSKMKRNHQSFLELNEKIFKLKNYLNK